MYTVEKKVRKYGLDRLATMDWVGGVSMARGVVYLKEMDDNCEVRLMM